GFVDGEVRIVTGYIDIRVPPSLRCSGSEGIGHGLNLAAQFNFIEAAGLGFYFHPVGDDIGGLAPVDDANIGRGFVIDSAELHAGDGVGRDFDGADTRLRPHTGVGLPAVNYGFDAVVA